jgi:hypothetical protein
MTNTEKMKLNFFQQIFKYKKKYYSLFPRKININRDIIFFCSIFLFYLIYQFSGRYCLIRIASLIIPLSNYI